MRVVQIIASPKQGGMEKHVVELSNNLSSHEVEIILVADKTYSNSLNSNIKLIPFNFNRFRYNPLILIHLLKVLRKENPDIIHCHGGKASQIASLIKPFFKRKYLTTIHGIKKRKRYLKNFDHIICVSNYIFNSLPSSYPKTTIYNGIKNPEFISTKEKKIIKASLNVPLNTHLWMAIGRLVKVKGFDQAIKAMQYVEGHLIIIGDGPDIDHLKNLRHQLELNERVYFIGQRDDVEKLIQCADTIIISSLREGFSYVFAEATLSKIPVISSNVPVANEILPKELIYPIGDYKALSNIMKLITTEELSLSDVYKYCSNQLTIEKMSTKTLLLYKELTNE